MDEKDKNIEVIQGGNALPPSENQFYSQDSININESQENSCENETISDLNSEETRVKYDDFMYEPIGFEEIEKSDNNISCAKTINSNKYNKINLIILSLILLIITIIGAFVIVFEVINSSKILNNSTFSGGSTIVLQSESKPKDVDEQYIDENGKYTTEGVAAAVRPCIVEIYTYYDVMQTELAGTGSGIIISEDGYIVTNAHVLESNGYHIVKTYDDKSYKATVVGRDTKTDIAVIKIEGTDFEVATLGDSDEVVVGEAVMAIGNPAGLSGTITNGIVSAVNRKIKGQSTQFEMDCIQTNADISPGNSGGALVNMYAQVIGITSSKYAESSYEGLGFAITINEAMPIIQELLSNGYISGRFRIGITLLDIDNPISREMVAEEFGFVLPEDFTGIYISEIAEDCDIYNTELKSGDFIISLDGTPISNYDELSAEIEDYVEDEIITAECARFDENGDLTYFTIEFKLMPDTSGDF